MIPDGEKRFEDSVRKRLPFPSDKLTEETVPSVAGDCSGDVRAAGLCEGLKELKGLRMSAGDNEDDGDNACAECRSR